MPIDAHFRLAFHSRPASPCLVFVQIIRRDKSYRRVSITIRKLLEGRKRVQLKDAELTFGQTSFEWQGKDEQQHQRHDDDDNRDAMTATTTTTTTTTATTTTALWKDYHSWRRKG